MWPSSHSDSVKKVLDLLKLEKKVKGLLLSLVTIYIYVILLFRYHLQTNNTNGTRSGITAETLQVR